MYADFPFSRLGEADGAEGRVSFWSASGLKHVSTSLPDGCIGQGGVLTRVVCLLNL